MRSRNGFAAPTDSIVDLFPESWIYRCLSDVSARCSSASKKLLKMLRREQELCAERTRACYKKLLFSRQKDQELSATRTRAFCNKNKSFLRQDQGLFNPLNISTSQRDKNSLFKGLEQTYGKSGCFANARSHTIMGVRLQVAPPLIAFQSVHGVTWSHPVNTASLRLKASSNKRRVTRNMNVFIGCIASCYHISKEVSPHPHQSDILEKDYRNKID